MSKLALVAAAAFTSLLPFAVSYAQDKPQIDRDAYAARGSTLTAEDPLARALRGSLSTREGRFGFNIGMAVAEGQTAPGPGKDAKCASLLREEPEGCHLAVLFSVERNRNSALAAKGAAIAERDSTFANARDRALSSNRFRNATEMPFFYLGFHIGLGASEGQTLPGPGKDRIRDALLHPAEQAGFNQAVAFALDYNRRLAGQTTTGTTDGPSADRASQSNAGTTAGPSPDRVASREIRCRGYARTGGSEYVFFTINSRPSQTGETLVTYEIAFSPDTRPAGTRGENLRPGFCAFVDRPIAASGPYRIRFETVANAQLKQTLHGSTVDRSSTAAENYPDVNSIPIYLKGENHYWSFGGVSDSGSGYFVATGNGYWKPPVSINEVPQSPTAPARRSRYPTKP